jgi:hypothetical protein
MRKELKPDVKKQSYQQSTISVKFFPLTARFFFVTVIETNLEILTSGV